MYDLLNHILFQFSKSDIFFVRYYLKLIKKSSKNDEIWYFLMFKSALIQSLNIETDVNLKSRDVEI